jgi:hypothetical protein
MKEFEFLVHVSSLEMAQSEIESDLTLVDCASEHAPSVRFACIPSEAPSLGAVLRVSVELIA